MRPGPLDRTQTGAEAAEYHEREHGTEIRAAKSLRQCVYAQSDSEERREAHAVDADDRGEARERTMGRLRIAEGEPWETGEEPAANSIRVNDVVFMPSGFPVTAQRVRTAGFVVIELENSECQKIDGGLSCLSLRFSPS